MCTLLGGASWLYGFVLLYGGSAGIFSALKWISQYCCRCPQSKQEDKVMQTDYRGCSHRVTLFYALVVLCFCAASKAAANVFGEQPAKPPLFQQHKSNYALVYSNSNEVVDPEYKDEEELKFQLSVKTPLIRNDRKYGHLYVAYTQKSFWQVYDSANSRPFRETNYNPEVVYQYRSRWHDAFGWGVDVGFEHESNGQLDERTRSWNRFYAIGSLMKPFGPGEGDDADYMQLRWKAWHRTEDEEDENPGIENFYGNMELNLGVKYHRYQLQLMRRIKAEGGHDGTRFDVRYKLSDTIALMLQYWDGYGESLERYNLATTRWGIGFALVGD